MTIQTSRQALPRVGNGSLTDQTTATLLDAILEGSFSENRLPPEPQLAIELGVSRTTIRGALMSLERLGVITRTPGRGTLVRPHVGRESIILQRLIGFRGLLEEKHKDVVVNQRYWLATGPSERAIERLGLSADDSVIRSEKTLTADGQPAIYVADEIPLQHCSPADQEILLSTAQPPVQDSIFEFSKSWQGGEIEHTVIELVPAVSPHPESTLDLPAGTPYMRLLETHYSFEGHALALSEVHVDDRYVRFNVVRHN